METCSTSGDTPASSAITTLLVFWYAGNRGDRNAVLGGQSRRAWAIGMAEWAP
jgi:hypothetical protein